MERPPSQEPLLKRIILSTGDLYPVFTILVGVGCGFLYCQGSESGCSWTLWFIGFVGGAVLGSVGYLLVVFTIDVAGSKDDQSEAKGTKRPSSRPLSGTRRRESWEGDDWGGADE